MFRTILSSPRILEIERQYFAISILFIAIHPWNNAPRSRGPLFFYFYFIHLLYQSAANTRHSVIVLFVGPRAVYSVKLAIGLRVPCRWIDTSICFLAPRNSERRSESNVFVVLASPRDSIACL